MGVGVSGAGAGAGAGPRPGPPAQPSPACAPARPPAQPARARGIVRWNTAPSSPRRGGKTPWCSPSKVGAATSQNFASPPGGEGASTAQNPSLGPRSPGAQSGGFPPDPLLHPPLRPGAHPGPGEGCAGPRAPSARGGGASSAQLSLCPALPPPGQRDRGVSARSASPLAPILSRVGGWGRHFPAPECAAAPGPRGERWGGEGNEGVPDDPELEWSRDWSPAIPSPHPSRPQARGCSGSGR